MGFTPVGCGRRERVGVDDEIALLIAAPNGVGVVIAVSMVAGAVVVLGGESGAIGPDISIRGA